MSREEGEGTFPRPSGCPLSSCALPLALGSLPASSFTHLAATWFRVALLRVGPRVRWAQWVDCQRPVWLNGSGCGLAGERGCSSVPVSGSERVAQARRGGLLDSLLGRSWRVFSPGPPSPQNRSSVTSPGPLASPPRSSDRECGRETVGVSSLSWRLRPPFPCP